jgi:hypothetical protein
MTTAWPKYGSNRCASGGTEFGPGTGGTGRTMVPAPMGGPAARGRAGTVCKPELARACVSRVNSKKKKKKKKNQTHTQTTWWFFRLTQSPPGPPGCAVRQGAPHSCRDHGPGGPDGPGRGERSSLQVSALSLRSARRLRPRGFSISCRRARCCPSRVQLSGLRRALRRPE